MNQTLDEVVVSLDWLVAHLDDPELVIVDVRPRDHFAAGHIPGARTLDLYPLKLLASDPETIDAWVATVETALERAGIGHNDRVVFYEDFSGTVAAPAVWLMHALSITPHAALLDGGLTAWLQAGQAVSTEPAQVQPTSLTARLDTSQLATASDILTSLGDDADRTTIVDTRSDLEWMQGTIPGARHLEWVRHLTPDGRLRSPDELRALYREAGIAPDQPAITFCATGYRAAHTWLVLRLLGNDAVRNYAPSWAEWGRRGDLPIESPR